MRAPGPGLIDFRNPVDWEAAGPDPARCLAGQPEARVANRYQDPDGRFFAGDWATARAFLDIGFTLSFTGVVTFTHDYDEVVKNAPLDMILTETDAPYITPAPHRGKRNEPSHIPLIAQAIARIRGEDEAHVRERLAENARRVFRFA